MSVNSIVAVFALLLLTACVSVDRVESHKQVSGDINYKIGDGEVIETRDGLWGGIVINAIIPLPPLVLKHGEETTRVWKKDGVVVYEEKIDTRVNGVSCLLFLLTCGKSEEIGSWGDFLFGGEGGYH